VSNLSTKRKKTITVICTAIGGNGFVSATPSSNQELAKQVFMVVANVVMYVVIWDIYFDEDLSQENIKTILTDLGSIALVSGGTSWIAVKAIAALLQYIPDWLTSSVWIVAGIVAGLVTGALGIIWACYCDDLYRNPK
jgi:hypothetical protein